MKFILCLLQRAEDVRTDKVDSELLTHLTRMDWLPTAYVPPKEVRQLRSLLRHRAFRRLHGYKELNVVGIQETRYRFQSEPRD